MLKFLPTAIIVGFIFCLPAKIFAQYLNLGKIETCSVYSVNGALTNTGVSTFNGDVGAQIGSINNFPASTSSNYTVHNTADAFTAQAKIDLLDVYILLNNVPVTNTSHVPAFSNETISPGVYLIKGAGSIAGTVTLDGGAAGANAVFILKFQGALSPATASQIVLANGTRACNVFWIAEGAIAAGTGCNLSGTFLAHPGAVTIGSNGTLNGRMLSTTGAINFGPGTLTLPVGPNTVLIDCVNHCFNNTLGTAANFALFTSAGALANTGISGVIGDIGSGSAGGVSGFETSIVIGTQHSADATTTQAALDLQAAYDHLIAVVTASTTKIVHDGAYGGAGETLYPGIYTTAAAGSVSGTLTLNGNNDPNSLFIFQIGAALSVAAQSRVILVNGARRCNIFWTAEGAIDMATFTFMKGNLIAHNGAISMGGQGFLEGRMFSTGGACSFNTATTYISNALCGDSNDPYPPTVPLAIQLTSFTGNCYNHKMILKWTTATELNNKNFTVERSADGINWQTVGTVPGAGNSTTAINYSLIDNLPSASGTTIYRLKQTDTDNRSLYAKTIYTLSCGANGEENLSFSPNPSTGQFNLIFSGDTKEVLLTEVFNMQGEKVYQSNSFKSKINLSNQTPGVYVVRVHLNSRIITRKIVVAN